MTGISNMLTFLFYLTVTHVETTRVKRKLELISKTFQLQR